MADIFTTKSGFRRIKTRARGGHYMLVAWFLIAVVALGVGLAVYTAANLVDLMFGLIISDPSSVIKFNLDEARSIQRLDRLAPPVTPSPR